MNAMAFARVTTQVQSEPLAIGRKADPCAIVLFSQMTLMVFAHATSLRPIYLHQNENPEMYYTKVSISINTCPQIGIRSILDRERQFEDIRASVSSLGKKSVPVPALGQ